MAWWGSTNLPCTAISCFVSKNTETARMDIDL